MRQHTKNYNQVQKYKCLFLVGVIFVLLLRTIKLQNNLYLGMGLDSSPNLCWEKFKECRKMSHMINVHKWLIKQQHFQKEFK